MNRKHNVMIFRSTTQPYDGLTESFKGIFLRMAFCLITALFTVSTNINAQEADKPYGEQRVEMIAGHSLVGAVGYGGIVGYPESIWMNGSPWEGTTWMVEYEYIPKEPVYFEMFRLPCTISFGGTYRGYRSGGGKDYGSRNSILWQADMGLWVNYIGPEVTLKILTRSDRWTFNLKYSMGVMVSSFNGSVYANEPDYAHISFSTVKAGYGFSTGLSVQYRFNHHWSMETNIAMCSGTISRYMYNSDFPIYRDIPIYRWLDMGLYTIGVQYHF